MTDKILRITKDGILLDGKPITEESVLHMLSHIATRDGIEDLEHVLDYWILLREPGHNGFYIKQYHTTTTNKDESVTYK